MSPEIHDLPRRSRGYNNLCDLWAAGVTMYMLMFGGKHPFVVGSQKQQLDEKRMLAGTMDFSVSQGFLGGIGLGEGRFSEPARRLCRRLVEPDVKRRASAEEARADPWIGAKAVPAGGIDTRLGGTRVPSGSPRARSWWAVKDENAQPNQGEPDAELQKRIQALEKQVKIQHEHSESQFDALVGLKEVMQQLYDDAGAPLMGTARLKQLPSSSALPSGLRCRYNSSSYTQWMPAVVTGFNDGDGTYNLDVRQHARLENISPAPDAPASEAWPPGTLVFYESSSMRHWLPAIVQSYKENGGEGTYTLDVRDGAICDRIRPRLKGRGL